MNVSQHVHATTGFAEMLLKTILNSATDYKSFRFGKIPFEKKGEPDQHLVAEITPRKNGKAVCSECGRKCPTYDIARNPRRFEFMSLWAVPVAFLYRMRRVSCPEHGVNALNICDVPKKLDRYKRDKIEASDRKSGRICPRRIPCPKNEKPIRPRFVPRSP